MLVNLIRCSRCLMPSTRPDTDFVDGLCTACHYHDIQQFLDWDARRNDLHYLFERQKPNGSGFDCIVASSGGKDSTSQVLRLIELGYRPLVVTATTCMLTKLGRYNIDNLKRYAPTIEVTPNQDVRAKLNYLGLTLVGDISWPEHVAIFTTPIRMAVSLGIPLVFYGENPQAAYGGPMGSQEAQQLTRRWVSEFGGFLGLRPSDMIGKSGITAKDMAEYTFPDDKQLKKAKVEAHFLGHYLGPWDGHENARIAIEAGFKYESPSRANWWAWENLDNAMTGLHDYMMYRKYGYGRACPQLSVDIRFGRITRERAIEELGDREATFPLYYAGVALTDVCKHLGISVSRLLDIIHQFTNLVITFGGNGNNRATTGANFFNI